MLRVRVEIQIGALFFDYVASATINSTWKNLTDTCTIKIPRNLKTKNGLYLREVLWYGSKVTLKAGYQEYGISTRFTGYIASFNADTYLAEIVCEDEMYNLKHTGKITKSWQNGDVETIILYLREKAGATWDYQLLGDKISLGAVKFEDLTVAKCLQKLKDDYGLVPFFRDGVLVIGKPYETDASKLIKRSFEYGRNVKSWNGLKWKNKDDVKLNVKVTNHLPDGSKKEITVGDEGGEQRTLDFYNRSEADLKKEATALLERMKYDGYRGSIKLFGEPEIKHGYVGVISDYRLPERQGEYFIDGVDTVIGAASIEQTVNIGPKA